MKLAIVGRGMESLVVAVSLSGPVILSELARRKGIPLPAGLSSVDPDPVAVAAEPVFVAAAARAMSYVVGYSI